MNTNTGTNPVVRVAQLGGPEVLQINYEPVREPAAGEVRLHIRALGLNRAAEAYEQMYSGKARFRVVLTMGS